MRYFLLSSFIFIFFGCTSEYKGMQNAEGKIDNLQKFKPAFNFVIYKTEVNVIGKYLSGLLIFKKMPDSSTRIIFSNEMGVTFFDFGFNADGSFKVYAILHQMNKKAVIKTLKKDFELILMQHLDSSNLAIKKYDNNIYYTFANRKGFNYYITDTLGHELVGIENASKHKAIVKEIMRDYVDGIPDTIGISHTQFNFKIGLKRIKN